MRRLSVALFLIPLLGACAKSDSGTAGASAAAAPPAAAATPAMSPAKNMAGNWSIRAVNNNPAGKDSVTVFTVTMDAAGNAVQPMGKDTSRYHRVSGNDSSWVM